MMGKTNTQRGFTIVELLIVIVVIGILAAITIVAYNGVQQRARDTARTAAVKSVMKALELYRVDNDTYPSVGTDGVGYAMSTLSTALVPTYIKAIPNDPNPSSPNYQYVRSTAASGAYGIRVYYESKAPCHDGVNNGSQSWWGLPVC